VSFPQAVVDDLLARTGRMCAICRRRHGVQVHHMIPRHEGGKDDADNAIPLCPNCHDEVHAGYAPGRVTRRYTIEELRKHLAQTVEAVSKASHLIRGDDDWNRDVELLRFYAGCFDRPAFRSHFHDELSFADFDEAMEDTLLALNTGMWRTRDGTVIERVAGKRALVNPVWRDKLDTVVEFIDEVRRQLRHGLALDQMIINQARAMDRFDHHYRTARDLGHTIDRLRQQAITTMNEVLTDAGLPVLKSVGDWS
jgi:hypothetical protein